MKKKGFTLVELIAVIIILGFIIVLVLPSVTSLFKDSKEKMFNSKVKEIETIALEYGNTIKDQIADLVNNKSGCKKLNVTDLIKNGLLLSESKTNDEIYDPRDNSVMDGAVCICYDREILDITAHYFSDKKFDEVECFTKIEEINETETTTTTKTSNTETEKTTIEKTTTEKTTEKTTVEKTTTEKSTTTIDKFKKCEDSFKGGWSFDTSDGLVQEWTVPCTGQYKLTAYGAGGSSTYNSGNSGSMASGLYELVAGEKIYVYLGKYENSFNGGGKGGCRTQNSYGSTTWTSGNGSGATDFRLIKSTAKDGWSGDESLKSRIVTAGGGGGYRKSVGRPFGGYGATPLNDVDDRTSRFYGAYPSNKESGNGVLGQGSDCTYGYAYLSGTQDEGWGVSGGGGGGYYGGATDGVTKYDSYENVVQNGNNSNWFIIDGVRLGGAVTHSYNGTSKVKNYTYKSIEYEPLSSLIISGVNTNDGKAYISYAGATEDCSLKMDTKWTFTSKEEAQEWIAPCTGSYLITAEGAGGENKYNTPTNGGIAIGDFNILKDSKLYSYVGNCSSLYNGAGVGGKTDNADLNKKEMVINSGNGCGATDVRVIPSTVSDGWSGEESLLSRIVTAGGGGGFRTSYGIINGIAYNSTKMNYDLYNNNVSGGNQVLGQGSSYSLSHASVTDMPGQYGYGVSGGGGGGYYGGLTIGYENHENSYTVFTSKDNTTRFGLDYTGRPINNWVILNKKYVIGVTSTSAAGTSQINSYNLENREYKLNFGKIQNNVTSNSSGKVTIQYLGAVK